MGSAYSAFSGKKARKGIGAVSVAQKNWRPIPDSFSTLEEVQNALRARGLESSNLILGIDFTKSNEWTGKRCFEGKSLHSLGSTQNPYEAAVSAIAKTLVPFDDDALIPCYGFGDSNTNDRGVFSFYMDEKPCIGLEHVLSRYKEVVPHVNLAGPTSFAPIIYKAMSIVKATQGSFHILVIIADGQVTRPVDLPLAQFSKQEQDTMQAIMEASNLPLSIILVGVGDGPWDMMKHFDDNLPTRQFDNFQFVNFQSIETVYKDEEKRNAVFAVSALMEVPEQYSFMKTQEMIGKQYDCRIKWNMVDVQPPDLKAQDTKEGTSG